MNVSIKSVLSPFSFFCVAEDGSSKMEKEINDLENPKSAKMNISDVNHGQYVAVLWKGSWVRGIVSMEANFLIWLVDQGIYIRPSEDNVYVNLPSEYKKLPSKVFEASIQGVAPVGLELNDMCQFTRETRLAWTLGAISKAEELIACCNSTYFVPVAILSTKTNDILLGDLYLEFNGRIVNFVDEMSAKEEPMHMYMERNMEFYVDNLAKFYTNRRLHRACLLKPVLEEDLPTITTDITLAEYSAIYEQVEQLQFDEESDTSSLGGSSVTFIENNDISNKNLKLSQDEIEKYSNEYFFIGDREYNVLTVIMNKAADLQMCEKYKNAKSIGRATTRLKALSLG